MTNASVDEAVCYEAYGPGGTALLIACGLQTPSLAAAIREQLRMHGGQCGAQGSVAYLFNRVGVLRYAGNRALAGQALQAGAEDVRSLPTGEIEVIVDPDELAVVQAQLEQRGYRPLSVQTTRRAGQCVQLGPEQARGLAEMIESLRQIEGVQQVYTNGALP